ncbi:MAG: methyl-accepting chemotaxis protein, partial [Methanobacteriota archaeon]
LSFISFFPTHTYIRVRFPTQISLIIGGNYMREIRYLDNLKIGRKLIGGFIIVTLLMSSIGVIGFLGMTSISGQMNRMYINDTVPLMQVASMEVSLNSMRALVFRSMAITDERKQDEGRMETEIVTIDGQIQNLSSRQITPEEAELLVKFTSQWKDYKMAALQVFELEKTGKEAEALVSIKNGGDHANTRRATIATFDQLKLLILNRAGETSKSGSDEVNRTIMVMAIIGFVIILISLIFAVILTRRITEPLIQVVNQFDKMSRGEIGTRLHLSRTDEIGQMAGMSDRFSDFLEKEIINTMHQIARGDLSATLTPKSENDQITPALTEMTFAVTRVVKELERIAGQAAQGDLKIRGDDTQFQGSYRDIVRGFNKILDFLIIPINESISLAYEYAKCNFTARFSEDIPIHGDFIAFRNAMEEIGSAVSQALRVIDAQMKDLEEHAHLADSGISDVRRGAGIIAANADHTRTNAEQSEDEISQVLRAMEDLTTNITNVSSNVEAVANSGTGADHLARKGVIAAVSAEEGMEEIRKASADATGIILEIQGQMDEIRRITDIISDISDQTNLLALNAAIEAARAGEAGLGFAVVAGEVKALAIQAGGAAEKIANMIAGLERRSHLATISMKGAEIAIESGRRSLSETLNIFSDLTKAVSDISSNMSSVANSTEEQAASFEEITASVNEMSIHVHQTSKDALNSAATSEEALSVVEQITDIINEINVVVINTNKEMQRFTIG